MACISEFIFDSAPFSSCHASTIVQLRSGDLLSAWFGGSGEGRRDVGIWMSRRSNGRWTSPIELVREPKVPTWNPVLFHSKDQRLWLYYKFGMNPSAWRGARIWSEGEDEGERWSKPERLPAGIYGPIRTKPLLLNDGTIVSGTSTETPQAWTAWIERSADNGNTWVKSGPIRVSHQLKNAQLFAGDEPYGIIQPAIVSLGAGQLRLYARSSSQIGRICVADSFDDGQNWTVATPIGLPNPNSGIDAVSLSGVGVVLVFNNSVCKRTPLDLAISKDGDYFRVFSRLEHEDGEYSYPALVEGQDGALHLTYTWNRKRIRYVRVPMFELRHY